MGRFFRAIRGFFGSLLTGVEQRNPEILLETAVQDELNNLKKLQVAAARTMAYEKVEQASRDQERRYNDVVRERAALMEEHQRSRALRTANEARSNISLSDSSRDLEQARQAIRQASYEAEAVRDLGTSETQRQIEAAEADIRRLDAERELETIELQMGLRDTIEAGEPSEDAQVEQPGEDEEESRG